VDYDISPLQILILLLLPVDYDISPLQILKLEQYHKLLEAEGESVSPMTKTGMEEWRNIIIHW
jgi:hypothetical protein